MCSSDLKILQRSIEDIFHPVVVHTPNQLKRTENTSDWVIMKTHERARLTRMINNVRYFYNFVENRIEDVNRNTYANIPKPTNQEYVALLHEIQDLPNPEIVKINGYVHLKQEPLYRFNKQTFHWEHMDTGHKLDGYRPPPSSETYPLIDTNIILTH